MDDLMGRQRSCPQKYTLLNEDNQEIINNKSLKESPSRMPCTALCYMAFYFFKIYFIEYKKGKKYMPFQIWLYGTIQPSPRDKSKGNINYMEVIL